MNIVFSSQENKHAINVSVIIPTYNRFAMLKEALSSVFAQSYVGTVEVIVIDDNSNDGTPELLKRDYPNIRLISLLRNVGPSAARNHGIRAAEGQYIAFLDSDDLWHPSYLNEQVSALKMLSENHFSRFSVSDIWLTKTEKDFLQKKSQKPKQKYSSALHHLLSGGSFVSTPSAVVFPRYVLDKIGLFDESLRFGEDTDLYTRAIAADFAPNFVEKPLVYRRKHDNGQAISTENLERRIENRIRAAKKYYPILEDQLNGIESSRIFAEIFADFSKYYYREKNYFGWLKLLFLSTGFSSPYFAIKNIKEDITSSIKAHIKSITQQNEPTVKSSTMEGER